MTEEKGGLYEIPKSWRWITVDDIALAGKDSIRMGPFGSQLKKNELVKEGIRVLWIENIVDNIFEYKIGKFVTQEKYEKLKGFTVSPGELLITMMGTIGRVAIVPEDIGKAIISSHLSRVKVDSRLCNIKYLKYAFLSEQTKKQLNKESRGVVMKGLNTKIIKSLIVPLPPLQEQERIIRKIEELFSFLDSGTDSLYKVEAQLKRYRKTVLRYAFEGKLTEVWRKTQKHQIETAQKLLDEITDVKRKTQTEKSKEYLPIQKPTFQLPDGWVWTNLGEAFFISSGQTPKGLEKCGKLGEIPFFKVSDMNRPENGKFMTKTGIYLRSNEIRDLGIKIHEKGTIIFPKRGGAIATNKKRILAQPSAFDLNIMGVTPIFLSSNFVYYWFSNIDLATLSDGSNVPQINHKDIYPLPFALPSLKEQEVIENELERRLSISEQIEKTLISSVNQAERLRQSILKKAFEGKLVPQNPSEEPVEILVQRFKWKINVLDKSDSRR